MAHLYLPDLATALRLATVIACYYRPKPGGFCRRLFRAIEALLADGHSVHYLAAQRFPIDHPRCHFHWFPWPARALDTLPFWVTFHLLAPWALLWLGLRWRATHAFAFGANYAFMLQPARLARRISLAVFLRADTLHNHHLLGRSSLLIAGERLVEGLGIAGTNLYAVSGCLLDAVLARHRLLRPRRAGVLRNEVLTPIAERRTRPVAGQAVRLSCVGVLEPRKNQVLAVRCVAALPPGLACLSLFGSGPAERELGQLVASLGVTDRVSLRGWTASDTVWRETDLLLFPSLHEGAPNALLEALGLGIPVLASDIPEHREILGAEDLLPLSDPAPWAAMVSCLAGSDPRPWEDLVARQQRAAKRLRFDWDGAMRGSILGGEGMQAG